MSGIAGIFYLDGRPAEQETISQMVDAMEHRGPDGIHTWRGGSAALGHCMLHTTPESAYDNLPMTSRDGNLVLTADARIDNRKELMQVLDVRPMEDRPVTDCDLIMAAYRHWGKECPKYLLGVFAFAILDKRVHKLFIARDHFGVRPLYYSYDKGRRLVFASEIRALISHGLVSRRVNEQRVADYLCFLLDNKEYTFFENIDRLKPGSWMVFDTQAINYTYYKLKKENKINYDSNNSFGDLFRYSVKNKIRSKKNIGCYLSGGIDSSSVLAQAHEITKKKDSDNKLNAISAVFEDKKCDESLYIDKVSKYLNINIEKEKIKYVSTLNGARNCIKALTCPVESHPLLLTDRLEKVIERLDIRVMLDGHGGDEVAFKSNVYLNKLARNKNITNLYRSLSIYPKKQRIGIFIAYVGSYSVESKILSALFNKISRSILDTKKDSTNRYRIVSEVIDEEVLKVFNFRKRVQAHLREKHKAREVANNFQRWSLNIPLQVHALEELNGRALYRGHEPAFPFWDRELIEYSLAIPAKYKLGDGRGRQPLRDAMKGKLPEDVLNRSDKTNFHKIISDSILRDKEKILQRWETIEPGIKSWLSPRGRRFIAETVNEDGLIPSARILVLWRLLLLGEWKFTVVDQ